MGTDHTPTPWTFGNGEKFPFVIRHDSDGLGSHIAYIACQEVICKEHGGTPEANAAFIVRAVNAHEELLEACKCAGDALLANEGDPIKREALRQLREAIAKSEGKL